MSRRALYERALGIPQPPLGGTWIWLDGGKLDLGLVRDATLVASNDFQIFGESFDRVVTVSTGGDTT